MSDQDYEHDAEHLDWQLDDEQSSTTDDTPGSEESSEDSGANHSNEQTEKSSQEADSKQGGSEYRSDGERVNSLVPASEMLFITGRSSPPRYSRW